MHDFRTKIVEIKSRRVVLRPMTQSDEEALFRWSNTLQSMYFDSGDEGAGYTLEQLQQMYRHDPETGYHFVIDAQHKTIGGCWLQLMDIKRITHEFRNLDCRRIGLYIGESEFRRRGIGTEVVRLLTQFGFEEEDTDVILACDVPEDDVGCRRTFEKNSYILYRENLKPEGSRLNKTYDLLMMRETYEDMQID